MIPMKNSFLPYDIRESTDDLYHAYVQYRDGEWETIKTHGDNVYIVLTGNPDVRVLYTSMNALQTEITPSNDDMVYHFVDEKTAYRFLRKLDSVFAKVIEKV